MVKIEKNNSQQCFISSRLRDSEKRRVREEVCSHLEANYQDENNYYCILHLPNEHERKKKDEFDLECRNKKEAQNFNFQWVCFPDDFRIFDKTIETEIDCSNAVFNHSVYLIGIIFKKKISFYNALIQGYFEIKDSTFESEVIFQECRVKGKFSIDKTHFNDSANFSVLRVCGFAYFSDNYFHEEANFDLSHFCRDVDFDDCEFNKAEFKYAKFFGEATFDNAEFKSEVRFDNAEFAEFVGFRKTKFKHICVFNNCLFFHEVYFLRAEFDDIAYFEKTNFAIDNSAEDWNHGGYFEQCRFKSYAFFNNSKFKYARFFSSEFKKTANFSEIEIRNVACFEASVFEGILIFRNAKFFQEVSFNYSNFHDLVSFRGNNSNKIFYGTLDLQEVRSIASEKIQFQTVRLFPNWFVNINPQKITFIDVDWKNSDGTRKKIEIELQELKKRLVNENIHRLFVIACRQLASNAEENSRFEEASNFRRMASETEWLDKGIEKQKWTDKIVRSAEVIKRHFIKKKVNLLAPLKRTIFITRHFDFLHPLYRFSSFYGESWKQAAFVLAIIIFAIFPFIYTFTEFQVTPKNIPLQVVVKDCRNVAEELKSVCKIENRGLYFWSEAVPHSLATASFQTVEYRIPKTAWGSVWMILEKIFAPLQAALLALAIRRKFMR